MKKMLLAAALLVAFKAQACECQDAMQNLTATRHSGYAYDAARSVSKEHMDMIMQAARMAPSSYNDQPWLFIVCDKTSNPEAFEKMMSTLVEFNQGWAKNASVLVATVAHTNSHKGESNRWAQYDTGAAAMCMVLQATSLGLMAHQMGGFDPEMVRSLFNVPADCVPMAVMAIGYEAAGMTERAKKERKPMEEIVSMGLMSR